MPRSLAPLPGESLPGLLLRLAYRLDRSPARVAELCGLNYQAGRISYIHLRFLPDDLTQQLAHTARLTEHETNNLTLRQFAGRYPALSRLREDARIGAGSYANWALSSSSRYCPECLRGDGHPVERAFGGPWQLLWHLPVIFACTRHHRLLEHLCPECDRPVNPSDRRRLNLIRNPWLKGLHPTQCRNASPPPGMDMRSGGHIVCCARLEDNPGNGGSALRTEDLKRLIALQERIIDHLVLPSSAFSEPGPLGRSYFPDLIATTQLLMLAWPFSRGYAPSPALADLIEAYAEPVVVLAEARRASRKRFFASMRAAPDDAAQCGALLSAADALLGDRDCASLRARLNPLAREAGKRSLDIVYHIQEREDTSVPLSQATSRRMYGVQASRKSRSAFSSSHRFGVDEVPALLPYEWYENHIAPIVAGQPFRGQHSVRFLRRAASLQLAQFSCGDTWRECALRLGMSKGSFEAASRVLRLELDEPHLRADFENAVEEIARDLDLQSCRIGYGSRRRQMGTWNMPVNDWNILRQGLPRLGGARTGPGPAVGSILAWTEVTQGEYIHSPYLNSIRGERRKAQRLAGDVRGHQTAAPQTARFLLLQRIRLYAERLAIACDQGMKLTVPVDEIVASETGAALIQ